MEPKYNGSGGGSVMQTPYAIPFDTLLPKRSEVANGLAAVPVSASHVRFSSLRMEPTWMIMGHAAGQTAVMALESGIAVQDVNVSTLQARLRADGQILYA